MWGSLSQKAGPDPTLSLLFKNNLTKHMPKKFTLAEALLCE